MFSPGWPALRVGLSALCQRQYQRHSKACASSCLKKFTALFTLLACVVGATSLAGCSSAGGITGAVAGVASGSATANPAVGVAVGITVKAGVDAAINAVLRYWSHEEQMRIAELIGALDVGETLPWAIKHEVPYANNHGKVTVVRTFSTPLADCKEALFSVENDDAKVVAPHFVTTVCAGSRGWKWALAEPAIARWGALQ